MIMLVTPRDADLVEIPKTSEPDQVVAFCDNAIALFDDCEKMEVSHLDLTRTKTTLQP